MRLIDDDGREIDVYDEAALVPMAELWTKISAQHKLMYRPTWLGRPIVQLSDDIVMMQELIWTVRPDVVVETGMAHGGSAVFYASMLALTGGDKVVSVDVEIRPHNRAAVEAHPLAPRIEMIEGSSVDAAVVERVRRAVEGAGRVLVVLDSNHSCDHVLQELELYAPLVADDSYLVAMDGAQKLVHDIPSGKPEWKDDHPLRAIEVFLDRHGEWEADPHYNRMLVTANPKGFLRRRRAS